MKPQNSSQVQSFGSRKPQKSKISDGYQNSERILKSKDFLGIKRIFNHLNSYEFK